MYQLYVPLHIVIYICWLLCYFFCDLCDFFFDYCFDNKKYMKIKKGRFAISLYHTFFIVLLIFINFVDLQSDFDQ